MTPVEFFHEVENTAGCLGFSVLYKWADDCIERKTMLFCAVVMATRSEP